MAIEYGKDLKMITLETTPEVETLLRLQAGRSGEDIDSYLLRLAEQDIQIDPNEYATLEDFARSVTAIQQGLEDAEAERTVSLDEAFSHLEEVKKNWRQEQQSREGAQEMAAA